MDNNALVIEILTELGKDQIGKLQVNLDICFKGYLQRYLKKYSKTKTLLYRDQPVDIKSFYVRTNLEINGDIISDIKVFDSIKEKERLVISGTAGCGKSTFCKSLFVDMIEQQAGLIPILIELRHLNKESEESLTDFIFSTLSDLEKSLTKDQVMYALKLGKVCLLLDGFDEIDNELKEIYEREIIKLSTTFGKLKIVVFSRPDNRFSSWEEFYIANVQPLDKEKAKGLIAKLEYDRVAKTKFLNDLDNNLYEKHTSFASNPLLLTMMLLTYEQIAEIPNKIHLFYEQAFLTLFNKHDSLKSIYKRKSHTKLALDDFKKLLSAFSMVSYKDSRFYFTETELLEAIENASKLSSVKVNTYDFMCDLIESVCIIQKDGLGYTFTHRSFQEYFTANFIKNVVLENKFELIDRVASLQSGRDDVIPMLYEMNKELVEKEWLIIKLKFLIDKYSYEQNSNDEGLKSFGRLYDGILTIPSGGIGFLIETNRADWYSVSLIMRLCPKLQEGVYPIKHDLDENEISQAMEKIVGEGISAEKTFRLTDENIDSMTEGTKKVLYQLNLDKHVENIMNNFIEKKESLESKHAKESKDFSDILFG